MGRPRTPTKLKVLKGTDQPCRLNPDEPNPNPAIPPKPNYLSDVASSEWDRITAELDDNGIITGIDLGILAAYCSAYGLMVDAEREWARLDRVLTTLSTNGIEMVHPVVTILNQSREQVRKYANELGATPASRSKVSGKKKEPEKKKRLDFL